MTTARSHIDIATGASPLPSRYSTHKLANLCRGWVREHLSSAAPLHTFLAELPDAQTPSVNASLPFDAVDLPTSPPSPHHVYIHMVRDFARRDLVFWKAHSADKDIMGNRLELLKILCTSNTTQEQRRSRALDFVIRHLDLYSGWRRVLLEGKNFQLGDPEPWWRPGDFIKNELARETLVKSGRSPQKGRFFRVSRQQYLNRVRVPIIRVLTSSPDFSLDAAALIALFTSSRQERQDLPRLTETLRMILFGQAQVSLRERSTAIPMQPLYSFPKEMRNLGSFFISHEDLHTLPTDPDTQRIYNASSGASAKLHQQSLLFYDSDLVARRGERPNQYIEVSLHHDNASIVDALIQAIETIGVQDDILVHLPRIVAGFFNAAQRDRHHDFGAEGVFWDTTSGKRLCNIIGFDSENKRHRARIQSARTLLQHIILHREVVELQDDQKTYKKVAWRGPLIELKREELSVEVGTSEGITAHSTFQAWQIAGALWKMITPRLEGGAPSFMSLDERAFAMDKKSSIPFNLYWTLVNRAYISRLGQGGSLSISIQALYKWSGLEGRFGRTDKLRTLLVDGFEKMLLHDLIASWECDVLRQDERMNFDKFLTEQVTVVFSKTHLESLGHLMPAKLDADKPHAGLLDGDEAISHA